MGFCEIFLTTIELFIIAYISEHKLSSITNAKILQQNHILFMLNQELELITNDEGIFDYDKLSNFSLPKNFHKPNSFNKNGLCIALISSNRPFFLIEHLTLLIYYIHNYEPSLKYDLVWVDTATTDYFEILPKLHQKFHFDKILHLPTFSENRQIEGIPIAYEYMIHLCDKNDYIMLFEEDLRLIDNPKIGFIQKTIDILDNSPHSLMGIVFRDDIAKKGIQKTLLVKTKDNVYNVTCQMNRKYQFTNAASIYRMSNIKELVNNNVKNKNKYPLYELAMAESARKLGMFFGFVDFIDNCTKPVGDCYGIFIHAGRNNSSRTFKKNSFKRKRNRKKRNYVYKKH